MKNTRTNQRGVTLVELLVTAVIISVGLLGVAALHLSSLRNNFDAHMRSQASALAGDIADRMRANRTAARTPNNAYTVALGGSLSGTTQAAIDVTQWKASLTQLLPGGDGSISIPDPNQVVTIKITWTERQAGTLTFVTYAEI